jgi:small-conductance mechanosensitive channel
VIRFDASTVMLQWATGGFTFLWVTTRGRLVGLGYGWLMRTVFGVIGLIGLVIAATGSFVFARDLPAALMIIAAASALAVSVIRKGAGVREQRAAEQRRRDRVEAMRAVAQANDGVYGGAQATVNTDAGSEPETAAMQMRDQFGRLADEDVAEYTDGPEFPPALDLVAPALGMIGVIGAAVDAAQDAPLWLAVARFVIGALFLGAVSDAMLLGHWYLVQPGLSRRPIHELNDWVLRLWPLEVGLLLIPTGMYQALTGEVSDGWSGMLTWFWIACALTTGILGFVTRIALRERYYSAVMAATGFLYLAILMGFCTDLIARAILS